MGRLVSCSAPTTDSLVPCQLVGLHYAAPSALPLIHLTAAPRVGRAIRLTDASLLPLAWDKEGKLNTHAHTHTCVHTRIHAHAHAHAHTDMDTHLYTHTCIHTDMDTHLYTHTCIHTHAYIYRHTYTQAHTHLISPSNQLSAHLQQTFYPRGIEVLK